MLNVSAINRRYFSIKIGNINLEVEPPKLKTLKKLTALVKNRDEEVLGDLSEVIALILNKNKAGYKVPDDVIDELDIDQMYMIITSYSEWIGEVRNSPN